jgi:ABC-type antimicrobial peptide transport system permease subunit
MSGLGWAVALGFCVALGRMDTDGLTMGFVPQFYPPLGIYAESLAIGLAIGLVASLLPGMQAARMTITSAMRKLE